LGGEGSRLANGKSIFIRYLPAAEVISVCGLFC
jgi:hypothetical protein